MNCRGLIFAGSGTLLPVGHQSVRVQHVTYAAAMGNRPPHCAGRTPISPHSLGGHQILSIWLARDPRIPHGSTMDGLQVKFERRNLGILGSRRSSILWEVHSNPGREDEA